MDFGEIFRVLRRRWRVSVPALLLTMIAAVGAYLAWPTTYQSTAEITLLGPRSLATQPGNGNNPYLVVGGLGPLSNILVSDLSTQQAAQQLAARGVTETFTPGIPPFAAGPFVTLELEGKDPAAIQRSMPVVISFAEQRLKALQENRSIRTPSVGLVGATVIAQPNAPTPVLKRKEELVAGVAILGIIAVFVLSFSAEARAIRRQRKSSALNGPSQVRSDQPWPGSRRLPEHERRSARVQ